MMSNNKSLLTSFPLVYGLVILFTSWTIYYKLPYSFLFYIFLILITVNRFGHKASSRQHMMAFLFFPLALRYFFPYNASITSVGVAVVNSLMVSSVFLLDEKTIRIVLKIIFKAIAIICIVGLFFHILRLLGVYDAPLLGTVNMGDRQYSVFPLHVYEVSPFSGLDLSMRFNSIFDEPGYLGTIIALYVTGSGLDLKNKWNIVLLIAGFFTLSLAYFAILFIYFILISLNGKDGLKRAIVLLFVVGIIIFIISSLFPEILDLFLARQEFSRSGADSRGGVEAMSNNITYLRNQTFFKYLFGSGYDAHLYVFGDNTGEMSQSNIFRLVFQIGYFGIIYLFLFFVWGIKKTYTSIVFLIVYLLSMYQRPQVIDPLFLLLLLQQMQLNRSNNKKKTYSIIADKTVQST